MNQTQNIVLVAVVLVVRGDLQRVGDSTGRLCYNMGLASLFSSINPLKLLNKNKKLRRLSKSNFLCDQNCCASKIAQST